MKPFALALLALTLMSAPGCALFHHKKGGQPELPPAAGIESEFRDRWIDKRAHELMAGKPPKTEAEARDLAAQEFAAQYPDVIIPPPGAKR